jgi:hypothetical protein
MTRRVLATLLSVFLVGLAACSQRHGWETAGEYGEQGLWSVVEHVERPVYPPSMLETPGGVVVVELLVGPDSRLMKLRALEAPHPDFVEAVRTAVHTWRFTPTVVDGEALAVKGKITYYFQSANGQGRVLTAAEKTAELRKGE